MKLRLCLASVLLGMASTATLVRGQASLSNDAVDTTSTTGPTATKPSFFPSTSADMSTSSSAPAASSTNLSSSSTPSSATGSNTTHLLVLLSPLSSRLFSTDYSNLSALDVSPTLPASYHIVLSALSSIPVVLNTTSNTSRPATTTTLSIASATLPTTYPLFYPLMIVVLLLSHLVTFLLRLPHLLLATLPTESQWYDSVLRWMRPYSSSSSSSSSTPPSSSTNGPSVEAKLYTLRRLASYLHLCIHLLVGGTTLFWRSKVSSSATSFNVATTSYHLASSSSSSVNTLQAKLGNLFSVYLVLLLVGLVACLVEKKCTDRWTMQEVALQQAYTGVRAEFVEWQRECQRKLWDGERQQHAITASAAAAAAAGGEGAAQAKQHLKSDPPAYPTAALCKGADADAKHTEEHVGEESLSWRLVGDRSGRIYN